MLTPGAAEKIILDSLAMLPAEDCPLAQAAGRILRQEVTADRDFPPFDRVTMDGFALRHAAWVAGRREFIIAGMQPAGAPAQTLTCDEACIEVMTGAMRPIGADTVVPYEDTQSGSGRMTVRAQMKLESGSSIHRRGSDHRAGDAVLAAGTRLGGGEIAVAAACGATTLPVARRVRITVVATGNELVAPDAMPAAHQIRRSNDYALAAALTLAGQPPVAQLHLPDDPAVLAGQLRAILADSDLVVLCGGVSAGKRDFLPGVLAGLGVEKKFHGIAQRPGKPLWFGFAPAGVPVFALPGNPVSAYTCLHRYVLPALEKMSGAKPTPVRLAALTAPFVFRPPLARLLPVRLRSGPRAELLAEPADTNTSGDLAGLTGTDGFIELPAGPGEFPAGYVAQFRPWV